MLYLKARRLMRGVSLRDVRNATGISVSILSQIETNRVNPRPDELAKLAVYLQADPKLLLTHVSESSIGVTDAEAARG